MPRLRHLVIAVAVIAAGCSTSPDETAFDAVPPAAAADTASPSPVEPAPATGSAAASAQGPTAAAISDQAQTSPTPGEGDEGPALLLPDAERWVVVEDWQAREAQPTGMTEFERLQLDIAPLDENGVPQLGRRISMSYHVGRLEAVEHRVGDAASLGERIDFTIEGLADGVGWAVAEPSGHVAIAELWSAGTYVYLQTMDPDSDLVAVAQSFTAVDVATWQAARDGTADQRLRAVEAVMQDLDPSGSRSEQSEPMPHWILPAPWHLEWVTDMTIWTPEQHAQAEALAQASRPAQQPAPPAATATWHYGYGKAPQDASAQFVPQINVYLSVFDEPLTIQHPSNYEPISALGMHGVISPIVGQGSMVELNRGNAYVQVQTWRAGEGELRDFLAAARFATDDPIDGLIVDDERFQPIELVEWQNRPPSWHAAWTHPDARQGTMSVWRLPVPDLRVWLLTRGSGVDMPADLAELIARGETVDFGSGTTYDPETELLIALRGIEPDDLLPIDLDDWIALVEPVNSDPLSPR